MCVSTSKTGEPNGAMKIGDLEVPIIGQIPDDLDYVNLKANKAYFQTIMDFSSSRIQPATLSRK